MSWQAASLVGCGAVALAGLWWYERRRPAAKLVALIATLAAFAVAARVLFAAVPNVQGTTDVALLAGYVLGPVPGLMVGALAAIGAKVATLPTMLATLIAFFGDLRARSWRPCRTGVATLPPRCFPTRSVSEGKTLLPR